ncbi:hypothetical protein ACUNHQ_12715 [Serratia sp. IR-2025]
MKLKLFSEPYSKTGNIAADGFKRLLGCPSQNVLETVLRESIQNSIDAARLGAGPSLLIRYRTLTVEQQNSLKINVLNDIPDSELENKSIINSISKEKITVLELCDFNTTGLGGPTNGDAATECAESLDFVNFIRNVGVARDTYHGGGTYGYGKTSLYLMSRCSTILIDSQTSFSGIPVRRFIGCHLGHSYDFKGKRFTGRHWWGMDDSDMGINPLINVDASNIASSLGIPERGPNNRGTSIMILDPFIDNEGDFLANDIIEILLWNFWPRLTETTPLEKKVSFKIDIDGKNIPVPQPEFFPPFDLFAAAMAKQRENNDIKPIHSRSPKKHLGNISFIRGARSERNKLFPCVNSIIPSQISHIALMRPVELVVKYIIGEPFHDTRFEWCGVFICSNDDEVEQAFAMSEPPAHDDWVPNMLTSRNAKIFVRGALRKIEENARNYANPVLTMTPSTTEKGPSLASTASRLGSFLDYASSKGPGRQNIASRSISKKKGLSLSLPKFILLELWDENYPCAVFEALLDNDGENSGLEICAECYLIADGAAADGGDLPDSFKTEIVDMMLIPSGAIANGPKLTVGVESGTIRIRVLSPRDAAIGLRLNFVS